MTSTELTGESREAQEREEQEQLEFERQMEWLMEGSEEVELRE